MSLEETRKGKKGGLKKLDEIARNGRKVGINELQDVEHSNGMQVTTY